MNAVGDHISALEKLSAALAEGVRDLRDLTSMVKIKYADDPGKLAEWMAASHIERPARRAKPGGGSPPAPTTPTTPQSTAELHADSVREISRGVGHE